MSLIEQALGKRELQENVEDSTSPQIPTHHKRLQIKKGFTTRAIVLLILPLVLLMVAGMLFYQKSDSLMGSLPGEKGDPSVQVSADSIMRTPLVGREAPMVNASVADTREETVPAHEHPKGSSTQGEDLKRETRLLEDAAVGEVVAEGTIVGETIAVTMVAEETLAERTLPSLQRQDENPAELQTAAVTEPHELLPTPGVAEIILSQQNLVNKQYNNALHLEKNGALRQAVLEYERVLVLDPGHIKSHNNLGGVYYKLGRFNLALACYEKALAIDSDHVKTYNNMGLALFKLDRVEEAIGTLKEAIAKDPGTIESYNNLGVIYKNRGEKAMAQALFEHALAIHPNNAELHYNLALLYEGENRLEPAFMHYQKFIELCPAEYHQIKEKVTRHLFSLAKKSVLQEIREKTPLNNR